jgi:hypothetical protein
MRACWRLEKRAVRDSVLRSVNYGASCVQAFARFVGSRCQCLPRLEIVADFFVFDNDAVELVPTPLPTPSLFSTGCIFLNIMAGSLR